MLCPLSAACSLLILIYLCLAHCISLHCTAIQDMSGNYSPMEVSLIIRDIDMDGTQSVELGHFIKWWCSSSPSSLLSAPSP